MQFTFILINQCTNNTQNIRSVNIIPNIKLMRQYTKDQSQGGNTQNIKLVRPYSKYQIRMAIHNISN